jgi:Flp pilus assembly pilin Flp
MDTKTTKLTQRRSGGFLTRLAQDRRGAMVEYLVVVGLVAIAAIALFRNVFSAAIDTAVQDQSTQIGGLGTP